jgi:hypothetical protein
MEKIPNVRYPGLSDYQDADKEARSFAESLIRLLNN